MVPQDHLLELKLHDLAAILDCTHNITQRENTVQYPDLRNVNTCFLSLFQGSVSQITYI